MGEGTCSLNLRLMWSVDTGSGAYAAPLITDLHSDGSKEIVLPTFTHYVEVLDGATGNDLHGWPFAHPKLRSQASVLKFDLEHDGTPELMVATYTGELIFFRENGTAVEGATIKLPRADVSKKWTDFNASRLKEAEAKAKSEYDEVMAARHHISTRGNTPGGVQLDALTKLQARAASATPGDASAVSDIHRADQRPPAPTDPQRNPVPPVGAQRKLQQLPEGGGLPQDPPSAVDDMDAAAAAADEDDDGGDHHAGGGADGYLYDDDYYYGDDVFGHGVPPKNPSHEHAIAGTDGKLSAEAKASLDLVFHPELFEAAHNEIYELDSIFNGRRDVPLSDPLPSESDKVSLDAHILATPALTDLDYDGNWDLVIPVTYFLDAEYYAQPDNMYRVPVGVELDNYVKAAIVVVDTKTGRVKWSRDLGLTTKHAAFPAYMQSSPTVVNLDEDGVLDIVVSTTAGVLYAFDAHGNMKRGWPVRTGPVHGQPLVEDVNGDGKLDVCVGDADGTVSCFDRSGVLVWDRTVLEPVADGAVAGDVNGDGVVDIVVTTTKGNVWALDGRLGNRIDGFPVQLGTKARPAGVVGTALLVNLNNTEPPRADEARRGLHIVVTALDGAMYAISGTTGCVERHDIGHHSYTPVLADDVVGNGRMNLVVTTLTGQVMVFESDSPYTPLKAWPSQVIGMNGLTARDNYLGVFISPESREPHHVRGEQFRLMFEIVDERPARHSLRAPTMYFVAVHVGHQLLLYRQAFFNPGKHSIAVPVPFERKYATVFVSMRLPNGQHFEDSVAIAFNMHFLDGIKYIVLIPFVFVMTTLFFIHKRHEVDTSASVWDEEEYLRMHVAAAARRRRTRWYPGYK